MIKAWVVIVAMTACGLTHATASSGFTQPHQLQRAYLAHRGNAYNIPKINMPSRYAGLSDDFIECCRGGDIDFFVGDADECRRHTRCLAIKEYKVLTNWYHDDLPNYIEAGMQLLAGESS